MVLLKDNLSISTFIEITLATVHQSPGLSVLRCEKLLDIAGGGLYEIPVLGSK